MLARIRKAMEKKDQGFTLIELLVVMVIIGILAAIAIPTFLNQKKKGVDSAIKSDLTSVAQQIEADAVDSTTGYPAGTSGQWVDVKSTNPVISANVKITPGDKIQYKAITDGYCLAGNSTTKSASNADGDTANGNAKYFWYNSTTGGLTAAPQANAIAGC